MRPIRSLLIYFAVVFLGGALLAPWLYWLAQWAAGRIGPALFRPGCHPVPSLPGSFPAWSGAALPVATAAVRRLARSWRELGFVRQGRFARQILGGFALGWASLAAVALLALGCGASAFVAIHSAAEVGRQLLNATWTAVVVAVLEELVFRGALFGLLRQPCLGRPP
jgi:uncharacterized protein